MTGFDPDTTCAIVGMSGRFAGASSLVAFWNALLAGRHLSLRFRRDELVAAGVPGELLDDPRFVPVSAALERPFDFDPALFNITLGDAQLLDPQQRLFLECVWEALESGGILAAPPPGRRIGVFAATSASKWLRSEAGGSEAVALELGTQTDFMATRASYQLDLRGPAMTVSTACSSSLVAVHLAMTSLLLQECDAAVAGGVAVRRPVRRGHVYEPGGIYSEDGYCRPYDARATGTVSGDGAGVIALKRLADAQRDGDTIYAVLLGSAVNNDGSAKAGFVAPSVTGQAEAVRAALRAAGVEPSQIGYIEGHGTGTRLGDPIEVSAFAKVWDGSRGARPTLLGSVKSNIGHLDAASGIAGLIKAALSVRSGIVPGTVWFRTPNPELNLDAGPFEVSAGMRSLGGERIALVHNLGLGGTNVSIVLAAYTEAKAAAVEARGPFILPVSARSTAAVDAQLDRLEASVTTSPREIAPVASTLMYRRSVFPTRGAVVVNARGAQHRVAARAALAKPRIVFAAPSFSAWHGRVAEAGDNPERLQAELAGAETDLRAVTGLGFGDIAPTSAYEAVFPACIAFSVAMGRALSSLGIASDALLGQSMGEISAAVLAGVMNLRDAIWLAQCRGRLIATTEPGVTMAVTASAAQLANDQAEFGDYSVAVAAGPGACVIVGRPQAMRGVAARLESRGIAVQVLPLAAAPHSEAMEPIRLAFEAACARIAMRTPDKLLISSLDGQPLGDRARDPAYWGRHLRLTNRWDACLAALTPDDIVIDLGPGRSLTSSLRQSAARVVGASPHPDAVDFAQRGATAALAELWCEGAPLNWNAWMPRRSMGEAPVAPFEARTVAVQAETSRAPAAGPPGALGVWTVRWTERGAAWRRDGARVAVLGESEAAGRLRAAAQARTDLALVEPGAADTVIVALGAACIEQAVSVGMAVEGDLCVVTTEGADVNGYETLSPEAAALGAFATVLAQERTAGQTRSIDLGGRRLDWDQLLDEALDRDGPRMRAVRDRRVFVPDVARMSGVAGVPVQAGGVYVLIGGLGRFGRALARYLAKGGARRIAFVSRTANRDGAETRALIAELRAAGTSAEQHALDATVSGAMTPLIDRLWGDEGRVDGIFQMAADLTDKSGFAPLADFAADEYAQAWSHQMSAKLDIARALAAEVRRRVPGFVCQFSSNAAILGGPGLAFYAAANAAVDAFAVEMRRQGLPWLSVRWDGWRILGETPQPRSNLERYALQEAEAFDLLGLALGSRVAALSVVKGDLGERWRAWAQESGREIARADATSDAAAPAPASYGGWSAVEQTVAALCEELLGEPIPDPEADLVHLGLQSLALMRLRLRLKAQMSFDLTLAELLARPTVSAIAAAVARP